MRFEQVWRPFHGLIVVAVVAFGCNDAREPKQTATDDNTVVAVVDGKAITQDELDETIRTQLDALDRSRYELRLQHLQELIAARVLGPERAQRDGERAFRNARKEAEIDIRLVPPPTPVALASHNNDDEPAAGNNAVRRSALGLTLVGTLVREDPDKSMAAIRVPGALLARNVHPGQVIVDGAVLVRVERNQVVLRHNGGLEFVPLSVSSDSNTPTPAISRTAARYVRTPDVVINLRRTDVDRALRDQATLDRSLTRAAPELDGRPLLVLGAFDSGSLFDLLQMQERDVLMQVNGEWVDDRRTVLWDALRNDGLVSVLVMRAGEPRAFAYEIH